MMRWPVYRITFTYGSVIDIAAAGLGSAIIDALVIANEGAGTEDPRLTTEDILKIRQTGSVYISPSAQDKLDVLDLIEGREHGSN